MDFSFISDTSPQLPPPSPTVQLVFAENGVLQEYPSNTYISPSGNRGTLALMKLIEKEHNISISEQAILRADDGKRLESSMNFKEFFENCQTLHVFNMIPYNEGTISDDFEVICSETPENIDWGELGTDSLSELYEAFLEVETKVSIEPSIRERFSKAMTMFFDVKNELNRVKDEVVRLDRQKTSEGVTKQNLMYYYEEKKTRFDETFSEMKDKISSFEEVFNSFDGDLEKLTKKEVVPQLRDKEKVHLIDYLDANKARKNKGQFEKNQAKIVMRCQEMENEILQYNTQLRSIEENLPNLSEEIMSQILVQEEKFNNLYHKDLGTFQAILVQQKKSQSLPFSFIMEQSQNEAAGSFTIAKMCESTMVELKEVTSNLRNIRVKLEDCLKVNASKLSVFMSDVTNIQQIIKTKLYNKHTVFRSLVEKHEKDVSSLKAVTEFLAVYQASLNEINRRYRSKSDCITILNILENYITAENKQRDQFCEIYSKYIPKGFCPALNKNFPQISFEKLHKLVNQEESFSLAEFDHLVARNDFDDVVSLLKSFSSSAQNKENRIHELESILKMKSLKINELKSINEQVRTSSNDMMQYLEKKEFQNKFDHILDEVEDDCYLSSAKVARKIEDMKVEVAVYDKLLVKSYDCCDHGDRVVELMAELQNAQNSVTDLTTENVALYEEKKSLEGVIRDLNDAVSQMTDTRVVVKNKLIQLRNNINDKQQAEVLDSHTGSKNKVNEFEGLVKHLEATIDDKDMVIRDCKQHVSNLWELLAEKDVQINKIRETVKILQSDIEFIRETNYQQESELAAKDLELKKAYQRWQDALAAGELAEVLQSEKRGLEERLEVVRGDKKTLFDDNMYLTSKLKDLEETISYLQQRNFNLEESLKEKICEASKLKKENEEVLKEIQIIEEDVERFNHKISKNPLCDFPLRAASSKSDSFSMDQEVQVSTEDIDDSNIVCYCNTNQGPKKLEDSASKYQSSADASLQGLLGDIGEAIISLYTSLMGDCAQVRLYNQQVDLKEVVDEIAQLMKRFMVKVTNIAKEDKVLAMKIPGTRCFYQVIDRDAVSSSTVCLFKADEDHGSLISGTVHRIRKEEKGQDYGSLLRSFNMTKIMSVELVNVERIGLLNRRKSDQ